MNEDRADRAERLARAGQWLRAARERAGYSTLREFAAMIEVDPSQVSNYERGIHAVDDARATLIARALRMDEIEVRRNLGLWVPADGVPSPDDLATMSTDQLIRWGLEIARRHPDDEAIQHGARLLATLAEDRAKRDEDQPDRRTG